MRMTYGDRIRKEGREEGREEGLEEGREEGRQEILKSMQEMLLRQITGRFGEISKRIRDRIRAMTSMDELSKLGERIVRANSLEELGLA